MRRLPRSPAPLLRPAPAGPGLLALSALLLAATARSEAGRQPLDAEVSEHCGTSLLQVDTALRRAGAQAAARGAAVPPKPVRGGDLLLGVLFTPPVSPRVLALVILVGAGTLAALLQAAIQIIRHAACGMQLTGTMVVHDRALMVIDMLAALPIFALTGFFGILLPEFQPGWRFIQTLVMVANFKRVPLLFASVVGGRAQMGLMIKTPPKELEPLGLFSGPPCCCTALCLAPRAPRSEDLVVLRIGVLQFAVVQLVLALLEMVFSADMIKDSHFAAEWLQALHGVWCLLLKVTSIFVCMASCKGLYTLVEALNEGTAHNMSLEAKLNYCRCYILSLNLLPHLMRNLPLLPATLSNGATLTHQERITLAESIAVCCGVTLCSVAAWFAFPADEAHYPELFAQGAGCYEQSLLKVSRCPFCGSAELLPEPFAVDHATVCCKTCGRHGIPELMVTSTWVPAGKPLGDQAQGRPAAELLG